MGNNNNSKSLESWKWDTAYAIRRAQDALEYEIHRASSQYLRDGRSPIPEKEITSKIMSSIPDRNTKPEIKLRKLMYANGVRGYRLHWKKVPGRPDICFPGKKIAIFVNGCFWHRCPNCSPSSPKSHIDFWENKFIKNIKRDKEKISKLDELGWRTFVFWECQINNNSKNVVKKIFKIVG